MDKTLHKQFKDEMVKKFLETLHYAYCLNDFRELNTLLLFSIKTKSLLPLGLKVKFTDLSLNEDKKSLKQYKGVIVGHEGFNVLVKVNNETWKVPYLHVFKCKSKKVKDETRST